MLLKGFPKFILRKNSNYLNLVIRSKSSNLITNSYRTEIELLRRISPSTNILSCRNYCNGAPNQVQLPPLTDDTRIMWPELFKTLTNFIQCTFVIKPYMDRDFNLTDFLNGAKQALTVVSSALAKEDYDSIESLVDKSTIEKTRNKINSLTPEQKQLLEIHKDDIYLAFPYQVGIIFDKEKADQKFVEITVVFHSLRGLQRMRTENKEPPLNMGLLPEYQNLMYVCNYRFIREFRKNVESSWHINMINHFMPVTV